MKLVLIPRLSWGSSFQIDMFCKASSGLPRQVCVRACARLWVKRAQSRMPLRGWCVSRPATGMAAAAAAASTDAAAAVAASVAAALLFLPEVFCPEPHQSGTEGVTQEWGASGIPDTRLT